ncbi:hypothetical protein AKO1_004724 [Acrasis kona]|uniref:histidine kinase n=1 Tax=Acrasis kona TaxID=1008807 RepID=A0AAW2Z311_9EUKA
MFQLKTWSEQCPENYLNKYLMVQAEYAAHVQKDQWQAMCLYESAIESCISNHFLHESAIAYELQYLFLNQSNCKKIARGCLQSSYEAYHKWGARRKAKQMLLQQPSILTPIIHNPHLSSSSHTPLTIDTHGVIKAAQILSSSVDTTTLLNNMINIIMETSGATNAFIIIDGVVEAQASQQDGVIHATTTGQPYSGWTGGSKTVVDQVMSTKLEMIIECAYLDSNHQISSDPFISKNKCKSILCTPIAYQGDLKGVLYINNDLMSGCFKPNLVSVLSILSTQLAISLQNKKYFENQLLSIEKTAQEQTHRAEREEANRRKQEEFIDRICHEIRNPIQGIYGNCEAIKLIMEENVNKINPDQCSFIKECIDSIEICSRYQRIVTDDVLLLSKLEMGLLSLHQTPVNIHQVVTDVISMNMAEAVRNGLQLITNMNNIDKKQLIITDANRLSMVLINFITNAIKFTSKGSITLSCDMSYNAGDVVIVFSVKDTGCGMEQDEVLRLFKRFSQGNQTVHSEYGGSGLGLFISKIVVGLMGGEIKVKSVKGQGSEFIFDIHCTEVKEKEIKNFYQPIMIEGPLSQVEVANDNKVLHVLVVEDNKINQKVIVNILKNQGCQCVTADNGQEAHRQYLKYRDDLDLIISDVVMPVMNGYDSTKLIRQSEASFKDGKHVYIVGLSGNMRKEHHDTGLASGMDAFYNKPCTKEDIRKLVEYIKNKPSSNVI